MTATEPFVGTRDGSGPRGGGAAHTLREECERLFCEILKVVFFGERSAVKQDLLVTGAHRTDVLDQDDGTMHGLVTTWIEVWDYVGDTSFRGFVTGEGDEKCLFIFFDRALVGKDLKHG